MLWIAVIPPLHFHLRSVTFVIVSRTFTKRDKITPKRVKITKLSLAPSTFSSNPVHTFDLSTPLLMQIVDSLLADLLKRT